MNMVNSKHQGSTKRVGHLLSMLRERGASDRQGEWFTPGMLPDFAPDESAADIPLIERRAKAFKGMLETMTNEEFSKKTHTFEIKPGELIVGVIPMGSLGFGKVFPNYLTEKEKHVAFFTSRGVESVLGHNAPDFSRVLKGGLKGILKICQERRKSLGFDNKYPLGPNEGIEKKISFYKAVEICCKALVDYAKKFAELAERKADEENDAARKKELLEIARICRKVPLEPAGSFYEAVHSTWFVHLAFHSTVSHLSLGRLDQVLQPYLEESISKGEIDEAKARELLECFFIKCAERLTLTMQYVVEQDHQDFGTGMGHNPFLVDQEATVNQFMQNIVIGGQTRDGKDATNRCTYLFLDACAGLGLPTPTVNLRLHKNSSEELLQKTAQCALNSGNGQPIIYNDEIVVPAFSHHPAVPEEEALDYVVDGCWEVIMNGKCDFNYNMVNMLTVMECALNGGALISSGSSQLRGTKMSYLSPLAPQITTFDKLKEILRTHLQLFANKAGMQLYSYYTLEGSVTPVPFFSAMLGNCLEKGIDKTWGGADYNIAGIVFIAMPNVANSLAAIKEWVYDKKVYTLAEVVKALRHDFKGSKREVEMKRDFEQSPKFGNNREEVDEIMAWLLTGVHEAVQKAQKLSDYVFLTVPETPEEAKRVKRLRNMAEYEGPSMKERFGKDFNIAFTAGCGTFAQYAHFGIGCAASADGRGKDQPVAPNFSPFSGTAHNGEGAILESLKDLGLNRYGTGVMLDICLEEKDTNEEKVVEVMKKFTRCNGSIMSLTIVGHKEIEKIYELCNEVREGIKDPGVLYEYNDVSVRVGGWNSPFVTLTKVQQENYLKRMIRTT
jgi:formate C-acetyltransferase